MKAVESGKDGDERGPPSRAHPPHALEASSRVRARVCISQGGRVKSRQRTGSCDVVGNKAPESGENNKGKWE